MSIRINPKVSKELDFLIIHNQNEYKINLLKFYQVSSKFNQEFIPFQNVLTITDSFSEESFNIFLKLCMGEEIEVNNQYLNDILSLCIFWRCEDLQNQIDELICKTSDVGFEIELSKIKRELLDGGDISKIEELIIENFKDFCIYPEIGTFPIGLLIRIASKIEKNLSYEKLYIFLSHIHKHHQIASILLFFLLPYENLNIGNFSNLFELLGFSKNNNAFTYLIKQLLSVDKELNESKKSNEELNEEIRNLKEDLKTFNDIKKQFIDLKNENKKIFEEKSKLLNEIIELNIDPFKSKVEEVLNKPPESYQEDIFKACSDSDLNSLIILLNKDINLINSRDNFFDTPLHYAAKKGNIEIVKFLISRKCNIDAQAKDVNFFNLKFLVKLLFI